MKLPTEIDRMLWEIAESRDPKAIGEFGQRFPHLTSELGKRLALVNSLKSAKDVKVISRRPTFDTKNVPKASPITAVVTVFSWAISLSVLLVASFLFTKAILSRNAPNAVSAHNAIVVTGFNSDKPNNLNGVVKTNGDQTPSNPPPNGSGTETPRSNPNSGSDNQVAPNSDGTDSGNLVAIRLEGVPLITAIQALAKEAHFNVQFAPQVPNPTIKLDYPKAPADQILSSLGATFGFTALNQGSGNYYIVPARDPNTTKPSDLNGSAAPINAR